MLLEANIAFAGVLKTISLVRLFLCVLFGRS